MSGGDGLNFDDILKKVAGSGVDLGESETTISSQKEEVELKDSVAIEQDKDGSSQKTRKGKTEVRKKRKKDTSQAEVTFNIKNYSRTLIQKDLLNFLQVIHPSLNLRDIVNSILQDYVAKNQHKIQKAMTKSVKKID